MSKEVSLIDYDKETEAISKYEHYSVGFHNTFGDIRSLHVRLTPLDPVAIVILHGPENADAWNGSFTELPIYDENGHVIDYGTYTAMEAYPDTYYADGTPATWGAWIAEGGQANIEKDGMTYTYVYSVSMP